MAETKRSHDRRAREGFFRKYIQGKGIDIGVGRSDTWDGADPLTPDCFQHDKSDCDAHTMEIFNNESFDWVYASHVLEHLEKPHLAIENWYRILRTDGYLIICVPSVYRYEKKWSIPVSRWNEDHKRAYTAASLLQEIETALEPNSYLIEYLKDDAEGYDWSIGPERHPDGAIQYELVIKKIKKPAWNMEK
jgi:SAM-dependent methyltransferase